MQSLNYSSEENDTSGQSFADILLYSYVRIWIEVHGRTAAYEIIIPSVVFALQALVKVHE